MTCAFDWYQKRAMRAADLSGQTRPWRTQAVRAEPTHGAVQVTRTRSTGQKPRPGLAPCPVGSQIDPISTESINYVGDTELFNL